MIREIRTIALLMAIIIVCLALGTLNAPQRDLSAKQEEHQKRFGAVYMTLNNPFYEIIDEEIRTEVEKHGDVLLSRDPALSVEKQTEEIEDLIREGVSVIFLNPVDFERMGPALEAARAAHIPVITIDTNVQDSDFVASTIETDNYAAGRACAEHLLQHADHANILLLKHSSAHSAVDRITGFRQTIAGHPGFTIVDEAECDGQLERAMPAIQEMLSRHPEADTVMALNDPSALGHALTGIAAGLDATALLVDLAPDKAKEQLVKIKETALRGLKDVRRSVKKLRPDDLEHLPLRQAIANMVEEFASSTGMKIDFEVLEWPERLRPDQEEVLYRVVQEGMTNARRHGHAKHLEITIGAKRGAIYLLLADDGEGADIAELEKGFGLRHMQERLALLHGKLRYWSDSGFTLEAILPENEEASNFL